jgi:negative regulator of flagellin synthesis FlgM
MIVGKTGGVTGPQPIEPNRSTPVSKTARPEGAARSDKAEISSQARFLQKLHELPEVRQDRIDQVKQQIEAGTYDTEEKIRAAVERLFEDIS